MIENAEKSTRAAANEQLTDNGSCASGGWFRYDGSGAWFWATRFEEPRDGSVTPVVTWNVMVQVAEEHMRELAHQGPPPDEGGGTSEWDGQVAVCTYLGQATRLEPDAAGLYRLGLLGWCLTGESPELSTTNTGT